MYDNTKKQIWCTSRDIRNADSKWWIKELGVVRTKIKNRKAAGFDEIPPELWKTRKFDNIMLRYCNTEYNQNPIDMDKELHPPFLQERWPWNCQELPGYNPYFYSG